MILMQAACLICNFPTQLGTPRLYAPQGGTALFTDNENNAVRLYGSSHNRKPYVKDAFHRYIVNHEACVNPEQMGTKSCIRYHQVVPPGGFDDFAAPAGF